MLSDSLQNKIDSGTAKKTTLPALITTEGKSEVTRAIKNEIIVRFGEVESPQKGLDFALNSLDFDAIFQGDEITNNRGKIAKRIKNNMRRLHGISLDPVMVSEIGNIASNYSLPAGDFIVEITQDLQDNIGRFCDSSSCFRTYQGNHGMGENSHHTLAMEASGDYQILLVYEPHGDRIARALICNEKDHPILFNAYGKRLNKLADIYGVILGNQDKRKVDLSSEIWINMNEGYSWGKGQESREYLSVDPTDFGDFDRCENCSDAIEEGCGYFTDDYLYCESCHGDLFTYCDNCEEYHNTQDTVFSLVYYHAYSGRIYDKYICEYCYSGDFSTCANCDQSWEDSDMIAQDDELYCESCHGDLFVSCPCPFCEDYHLVAEVTI